MRNAIIRLFLIPLMLINNGKFLKRAAKFEHERRYKEACYEYAIALLNGIILDERRIRDKIKTLWDQYGPFNFDDIAVKEILEHGDTPEKCIEAGHAATVSIIRKIVDKK